MTTRVQVRWPVDSPGGQDRFLDKMVALSAKAASETVERDPEIATRRMLDQLFPDLRKPTVQELADLLIILLHPVDQLAPNVSESVST